MSTATKETFPHVTAELLSDEYGNAVMLSDGTDENTVLIHPLQLRHFAERFAGMEPAGWLTAQPVKTLTRRLRTLAFHIDFLYDYIKNHSDHRHADLSFELVKVTALSEMADEFCADLPDDDGDTEPPKTEAPAPSASRKGAPATAPKTAPKAEQADLI